jgi:hypothetical protein
MCVFYICLDRKDLEIWQKGTDKWLGTMETSENEVRHCHDEPMNTISGSMHHQGICNHDRKDWYYNSWIKWRMAKCTRCASDIKSNGYDIEELTLPKATCYLVSCKQCKTVLGIVQEKWLIE